MKHIKKRLSWLLVVCMLLGVLPLNVSATGDTSDTSTTAENGNSVTVIAGSDFQNQSGNEAGAQTVVNILNTMKNNGYDSADGFLCCGDYDYDTVNNSTQTIEGITALKNAVKSVYTSLIDSRMVMVQGNHDAAGVAGLSQSGANDTDDYGVYVINEDDYMWGNSDEATIQNTANALNTYLEAKVSEKYSKPVFVV